MDIPFARHSYRTRSLPLSAQRLANMFVESAPQDAKAPIVLLGTPGLKRFADCGESPVVAMHVMAGVPYVVAGGGVHRINADGSVTRLGAVWVDGGPVTMADNGTQLALATAGRGYIYNRSTGVIIEITDEDFPGATSVAYLDGYFIWTAPDGSFFISSILDGTEYDALDFATPESNPDMTLRVYVDHREVWLFGTNSTEVWVNTGQADFPFERLAGTLIEKGLRAVRSVAKLDNTVFWLASDGTVRRADGYTPMRISTHAIEHAIETYAKTDDAVGFAYTQEGHAFYVLTFPSANATFCYDVATQLWHERQSGITPARWRANCYGEAYGKHLVGDDRSGKIFSLEIALYTEDGETIRREAVAPPIYSENRRVFIADLEIELEAGVGLTLGQGSRPQVMLDWSDDGGRTFKNERWASIGERGSYARRARFTQLGESRDRVFRIAITDPVPVAIYGATANVKASRT